MGSVSTANERMRKCLLGCYPPRRVQRETLVQQIYKGKQHLPLVLLQLRRARRDKSRAQVPVRLSDMHSLHDILENTRSVSVPRYSQRRYTYTTSNTIHLNALEPAHLVEVVAPELGLLDHLRVKASLALHHEQQHLVVRASGEEDLARVELVERAPDGPDVYRRIVRMAHD